MWKKLETRLPHGAHIFVKRAERPLQEHPSFARAFGVQLTFAYRCSESYVSTASVFVLKMKVLIV